MKWKLVAVGIMGVGLAAASAANANTWPAWQMPSSDGGKTVTYQINATVTDNVAISGKGTPFEQAFHNCAEVATRAAGGNDAIIAQKEQAVGPYEAKFQACMQSARNDQGQSMWDLGKLNTMPFMWSEVR